MRYPWDVMIDLETMGTGPTSAILSIGAVCFEPLGDRLGPEFYTNVNLQTCLDAGLTKDESTERWWAKPDKAEARKMLAVDQKPIDEAVSMLSRFYDEHMGGDVWSHGAGFDLIILDSAFRVVKKTTPWKFWDHSDTRVIFKLTQRKTGSTRTARSSGRVPITTRSTTPSIRRCAFSSRSRSGGRCNGWR